MHYVFQCIFGRLLTLMGKSGMVVVLQDISDCISFCLSNSNLNNDQGMHLFYQQEFTCQNININVPFQFHICLHIYYNYPAKVCCSTPTIKGNFPGAKSTIKQRDTPSKEKVNYYFHMYESRSYRLCGLIGIYQR